MAGVPIREQAINQNVDTLFGKGDIVSPRSWRWQCRIPPSLTCRLKQANCNERRRRRTNSRSFCAWSST
eukprot:11136454-Lingulodinium_polyedra.AAC.1